MKKFLIIMLLCLWVNASYSQIGLVVQMASTASATCTVTIAVAGSSTCTPTCACDYATNTFTLTPGTIYLWANALDVETGYLLGYGPGWSVGSGFAGPPPTIPISFQWGEARFSVDCGGGVTCAGDMIWPAAFNCAGTGTGVWSGCGLNASYLSGTSTIVSFW